MPHVDFLRKIQDQPLPAINGVITYNPINGQKYMGFIGVISPHTIKELVRTPFITPDVC